MTLYYNWPKLESIVAQVKSGSLTARSQVELALTLASKETLDSKYSPSFISLHSVEALVMADAIDAKIRDGHPVGDLAGIPIAVKDNIDWAGLVSSAGSPKAYSKRASHHAPVLQHLIERGVIPIGKTNMNEWATGLTGDNVHYGDVLNPHLEGCLSGGSSSGSARAVAMGIVPAALGSDTGGSIRMPAAWCGIVGLRPSIDSFPLDGVVPRSRSLDVVGPLTRTFDDCHYFLGNSFLPKAKPLQNSSLSKPIRIGWDPQLLHLLKPDVRAVFMQWADLVQDSRRAILVEQNWPSLNNACVNALTVLQKEFYDDFLMMCGEVESFASCLGQPVLNELRNSKFLSVLELDNALLALQYFASYFENQFDLPNEGVDLYALALTPCGPVVQKDLPEAAKPLRELSLAMGATGLPILGIPLIPGNYLAPSLAGIQLIGRKFHEHQLLSMVKRLYAPN